MENKLLWELEYDFKTEMYKRLYKIINGCTIKELLDIGFNNNHLIDGYCLGYKSEDGNYYESEYKYTDKFFNTKVKFDHWDFDSDNYTIIYVKLVNENDIKELEEDF